MMKYKGYFGDAKYDSDAKIFHGEIIGLKNVITFQAKTVDELEKAFKDSINDYIQWCVERNEKPEKTYSGKNTSSWCRAGINSLTVRGE